VICSYCLTENKNTDITCSFCKHFLCVFKRSPRIKYQPPTEQIKIESPHTIGARPEISWLSVLLPFFGMITVMIVVTVFTNMNPTMFLFTIPMTLIGVTISVTNYLRQRKKHKKTEKETTQIYNDYLQPVEAEIKEKHSKHFNAVTHTDPPTSDCFRIAKEIESRLWERNPADSDFMTVRIGSGSVDFSCQISIPHNPLKTDEDYLLALPQKIYDRYKKVENAPITLSLLDSPVCGIVGGKKDSLALVNNIVAQVTTHHAYTEVRTVIVNDSNFDLSWIKNLPHYAEIIEPEEELKRRANLTDKMNIPYYFFVITNPKLIEKENIKKYLLMNDSRLGAGTILLVDDIALLPPECHTIIEVKNGAGEIYDKNNASNRQKFTVDSVLESFESFGKSLGKIRLDERPPDDDIAKRITLYQMLGISSANELDLTARWAKSNVLKTLAAPLGVKEKNELVYLDVHEKAHGPNGLVAGTVGAGKSEILQAYVLSVAALYSPYDVGFVIIDFKGGLMASQFSGLPHLVGEITNIDGKELNRSLLSIGAELENRQRIFKANGVSNIDEYLGKFKKNEADTKLPHLVIIVDEFARLKAEQPDFMKEIIKAAQIGRALGIHLILATQRPSGQIDPQIESNSDFRLCLRVASEQDSKEVIGSSAASVIKKETPGRAYLKVGEESLDLFQSAFSGEKLQSDPEKTQLDALVQYINGYCAQNDLEKLPPICLPPLPKILAYEESQISGCKTPIGIYDDPKNQRQKQAELDIAQNTFVVGAAQSGKTILLQSIIRTLSSNFSPNEINIYIMDFGSLLLKKFEKLNHVGGVVTQDEDEKLKNLFKLLDAEISFRKKKLAEAGISSFSAYIDSEFTDLPKILLVLDNFYAYNALYGEEHDAVFTRLCKEGIAYGISMIVTNQQTANFSYKYESSFGEKITFSCNDTSEYAKVFGRCLIEPDNTPGRALCKVGDALLEVQTYLAFSGEKEVDRAKAMTEFIEATNKKHAGHFAKKIPYVPDDLTSKWIAENFSLSLGKHEYLLGLDYETVEPFALDLCGGNEFSIAGKSSARKQKILCGILDAMNSAISNAPAHLYIVDAVERPLKKYSELDFVKQYTSDYSEIENIIEDISAETEARYKVLMDSGIEALEPHPLIAVIVNNRDAIENMPPLKDILRKAKALKIVFIYADIDNTTLSFSAPETLKRIREAKTSFITDNLKEHNFFELPPNAARTAKDLQDGDTFYLNENKIVRIKLAKGE